MDTLVPNGCKIINSKTCVDWIEFLIYVLLWDLGERCKDCLMWHHVCRNPSLGLVTKAKGLARVWAKRKPGSQSKRKEAQESKQEEKNPGVKAKALQGCGPRGSRGVTSHTPESVRKCEGVWRSEHSHPQGNSHFGRWSPGGLSKLQRAIWRVKIQCLVTFFISLKSSWNVDV